MKTNRAPAVISLLILCLSFTACKAPSAEPEAAEKAVLVNVQSAEQKTITNEMTYPGQVKAAEQIAVISKLSGKVADVMADTGDHVKAGDVLFTMDEADLLNNIKSIEAQIATADAAIRSAQTGVALSGGSSMKSQILAAQGGMEQAEKGVEQANLAVEQREMALDQAQIAYDNALKNFNDNETLYNAGVVSKSQYDQMQTALTNAGIALDQAKNAYGAALISEEQARRSYEQSVESQQIITNEAPSENLRRAQDALAQATASKNSLMVTLETAKEKLEDAAVRSPIDGVVASRNVEPQAMLSAASVPFTVVSANTVDVKVNVTEVIVNKLSPGQKVQVNISAAADEPFTGEITTISPAANEVTSAFEVCIAVGNENGIIKPGMYAEASFIKEAADNAVVIPRSAVLVENEVQVVYTAEGDRAKRNEVSTGIDDGREIEITSGISAGDTIIVKGQDYVKDGSLVNVEESRGDTN